jgi:hypothetical protein
MVFAAVVYGIFVVLSFLTDAAARPVPNETKLLVLLQATASSVWFVFSYDGVGLLSREASLLGVICIALANAVVMLVVYYNFVHWHPLKSLSDAIVPYTGADKANLIFGV